MLSLLVTTLFASIIVLAVPSVHRAEAAAGVSFVLVGDSTTANATTVNGGGWGNGFCGSSNPDVIEGPIPSSLDAGTPCINTAKNGATTGTFVANGYFDISLASIKAEVAKGRRTLVTIQFGHNDMKIATPESMGQNLTKMVTQIRAIGGEPILVTSLTRRSFSSDGTISDTLGPWADETKLIASQQSTHLLDLHATSITYCEAIGPDSSHVLNRTPDDNTHLNTNGTIVFGRMLADLLKASYSADGLPIIVNEALTYNISHGIPSY